MFTDFIHNAYPIFIEEGFELLSDGNEMNIFSQDIDLIRFIKRQNTMLYIMNFWNMKNVDFDEVSNRNKSYKKRFKEFFEELNCSHLIVLNLFVTQEEIILYPGEEFHPDQEIYIVSWAINLSTRKIRIQKGELDEILNIKQMIHKIFHMMDSKFHLEDEDLLKYQQRIRRRSLLKERSKNTVLTYGIIGINIIVWLLMELNGGSEDMNTLLLFGANEPFLVIERSQYWRLITSMFLHIGLSHLLYNSFALYLFGIRIERYFGKIKFLFVYFISGIMGSIASIFFSATVSAGASGAIYGLLGALLALAHKTKREVGGLNTYTILIMILIGIGLGWVMPSIDNAAHIAGFLTGLFIGKILCQIQWRNEN